MLAELQQGLRRSRKDCADYDQIVEINSSSEMKMSSGGDTFNHRNFTPTTPRDRYITMRFASVDFRRTLPWRSGIRSRDTGYQSPA